MKQKDLSNVGKFLDSIGSKNQNSSGHTVGNIVFKPSESGKSIISNRGDKWSTQHDFENSRYFKK